MLEFDDHFTELAAPSGESYWTASEVGAKRDLHTVWTVVDSGDGDDGNLYIEPGLHFVNVVGFQVTKEKWKDGQTTMLYVELAADEEDNDD